MLFKRSLVYILFGLILLVHIPCNASDLKPKEGWRVLEKICRFSRPLKTDLILTPTPQSIVEVTLWVAPFAEVLIQLTPQIQVAGYSIPQEPRFERGILPISCLSSAPLDADSLRPARITAAPIAATPYYGDGIFDFLNKKNLSRIDQQPLLESSVIPTLQDPQKWISQAIDLEELHKHALSLQNLTSTPPQDETSQRIRTQYQEWLNTTVIGSSLIFPMIHDPAISKNSLLPMINLELLAHSLENRNCENASKYFSMLGFSLETLTPQTLARKEGEINDRPDSLLFLASVIYGLEQRSLPCSREIMSQNSSIFDLLATSFPALQNGYLEQRNWEKSWGVSPPEGAIRDDGDLVPNLWVAALGGAGVVARIEPPTKKSIKSIQVIDYVWLSTQPGSKKGPRSKTALQVQKEWASRWQ